MKPEPTTLRLAAFVLAACATLPAACDGQPAAAGRRDSTVTPGAQPAEATPKPSYEVLIATAAARRNRAVASCEELPGTDREACREGVEQEFEATVSGLEDSRGDQP